MMAGDFNDGCSGPKVQRQLCLCTLGPALIKNISYSHLRALPALAVPFDPLVNLVSGGSV